MNAGVAATPRTCLVTGATSGIGLATGLGLADKGLRVIGLGRDPARCAEARIRQELEIAGGPGQDAGGGRGLVRFEVADLASQAAIRELCRRLLEAESRLDVLVNNAGTFTTRRILTPDGIELQFAVNHLAPFLMTNLLLPLLERAPEARIITLSSGSHFPGRIRWEDPLFERRPYNGLAAYEQSKLANVLFSYTLARRLGAGTRVATYALDPGLVNTDMGIKGTGVLAGLVWRLRRRGGVSPREGAATPIYLAESEEAAGRTGLYWRACRPLPSSPRSYREEDGDRLWELSERLVASL